MCIVLYTVHMSRCLGRAYSVDNYFVTQVLNTVNADTVQLGPITDITNLLWHNHFNAVWRYLCLHSTALKEFLIESPGTRRVHHYTILALKEIVQQFLETCLQDYIRSHARYSIAGLTHTIAIKLMQWHKFRPVKNDCIVNLPADWHAAL